MFDTYLYGWDIVHVKTDLSSEPKRLQRMLLRLVRYNRDVEYKKGDKMVMSDPLSRACLDEPSWQPECCHELEQSVLVDDLSIYDARLNSFRKATACDANLQILVSTVLERRSSTENGVPQEIKSYLSCRGKKGERIIVLAQLSI